VVQFVIVRMMQPCDGADLVMSGSNITGEATAADERVNMASVKGRVAVVKHLERTRLFSCRLKWAAFK
jgi:hypothetical protein